MRTIRNHSTFRRLLCLMLCIATWRGPVVWLHAHADHERSQQADVRLSSHLLRFHQESPPALGAARWHLHIGLLRDLMDDGFGDDGQPSAPSNDEPILLAVAVCAVPFAASGCELSLDAFCIPSAASGAFPIALEVPCGSFLQTYGEAPLRLLTGVIRC